MNRPNPSPRRSCTSTQDRLARAKRALAGLVLLVFGVAGSACGGGAASGGGATTAGADSAGSPRPGGAVDLIALAPATAVVVLNADLHAVRQDAARYDRFATELIRELDLASDAPVVRQLLDHTDSALGAFLPGSPHEGILFFGGRFAEDGFEAALGLAAARHGAPAEATSGADGRQIYALGDATVARLDQWTWAIAVGANARAHLGTVSLSGPRAFPHDLLEFGPRIGLPRDSAQAWADQDEEVGVAMVGLVFAGENPQMVHNFVATVQTHLGL